MDIKYRDTFDNITSVDRYLHKMRKRFTDNDIEPPDGFIEALDKMENVNRELLFILAARVASRAKEYE